MRHYTHFATEERELSRVLLAQGFCFGCLVGDLFIDILKKTAKAVFLR